MFRVLWRIAIGLGVGAVAGGIAGGLVGCGLATASTIANPPQGEDFGWSITAALFTLFGGVTGFSTGLVTGIVPRWWVSLPIGAIVGFVLGFTWLAPTSRTPDAALRLAIPSAVTGIITGIVVLWAIAKLQD